MMKTNRELNILNMVTLLFGEFKQNRVINGHTYCYRSIFKQIETQLCFGIRDVIDILSDVFPISLTNEMTIARAD